LQTDDGGYALAGYTNSFDQNDYDMFLIKTNSTGTIEWYKTYGGIGEDRATSFLQTSDGGYAITGFTSSFGNGEYDILFIKTDSLGNLKWKHTYGGERSEKAWSILQTDNQGFIIAGVTNSFGSGQNDCWLIKTDQNGTMEWNHTYGGSGSEQAFKVIQTTDGGYAFTGETSSVGVGDFDCLLVNTDQNGTMQWSRTYGGKDSDSARALLQTTDGGYVLSGYAEIILYYNAILLKTDSQGYLQWERNYSGYSDVIGNSLIQTQENEYVIGGYKIYNPRDTDFFLLQTNLTIEPDNLYPVAYAGADQQGNVSEPILFNGTGFDPYGTIIQYRWDFNGDGVYDWESNTTGQTTYTYNMTGDFSAYLEVTDNNGSQTLDQTIITIISPVSQAWTNRLTPDQIFSIIMLILLVILVIILTLFRKTITQSLQKFFQKTFLHTININIWITNLLISFLILITVKFILSLVLTTPLVYNDEPAYAVIAKTIFQGNLQIIGTTPFAHGYPAGYAYLLTPSYLLGNNMDLVYRSMLLTNCILSSFILFPVFFIMRRFVNDRYSFTTALIVGTLPIITIHSFLLLSENVFYPLFFISCYLIIKVFTYKKCDKKFIILSLLLGVSLGLLVFVKATAVAMITAFILVLLYILLKNRAISSLKYTITFLPFIPVLGYILLNGSTSTTGYPIADYLNSITLIFSDYTHFSNFITVTLNEIGYFIIMSYIIFMTFTLYLFIRWRKIQKEQNKELFVFSLYGFLSLVFLILLTALHIYQGEYTIYTRYVSPVLPLMFMTGIIGINLFRKTKTQMQ
ncbi:MAG: PKD domain-containing protein, partial [Methanobacteriota archaeon]